ncbi:MAG TPA: glycosyltransferase family 4 protein [Nocardioidaceae bacterium]|nr:glycosyltransferase family 4 protein [Nocardioidaceae bacterium]
MPLRVGIVCPYSLDVPGGVQVHVRDLAEALIGLGHEVSVLAPSENEDALPAYVVPTGGAVRVPYNGSVARVSFGPVVAGRVRRWLRDGKFDVLHLHEPATPSISLLALWAADGPVVATFHTSNLRSRAMSASAAILRPSLEKITGRIAVSEFARRTLVQHLGGEPVVIPNGVYVDRYTHAPVRDDWRGDGPTIAFVGRIDESRKGLPLLLQAFPDIARAHPGTRLLVVGGGDIAAARRRVPPELADSVTFLGSVTDEDKASALRTADLYIAPNTGGESFGIVLIEAMAAGTPVLASDIPAFRRVLGDGACGTCFRSEDASDLTAHAIELLGDGTRRDELRDTASRTVRRYDWSTVATQIVQVYETVIGRTGGAT